MKYLFPAIAACLFLTIACKKNGGQNDNNKEERIGPFSIYSENNCKGSVNGLAADYTYGEAGKKIVFSSDMEAGAIWLPEFYLKKAPSGKYIVYSIEKHANDSTFWVWYDPEDLTIPNCSFSTAGCSAVKLEGFKNLGDVNGEKYLFKFDPDNPEGTTIETPYGRFLFTGDGKERATGNCNRLAGVFTSPGAACREILEGEAIWDWCFHDRWYFRR